MIKNCIVLITYKVLRYKNGKRIDLIIKEVENQQEKELVRFESNLSEGINKYKEVLPADLITPQLQEKIDNEVKLQLVEFKKSIELKT